MIALLIVLPFLMAATAVTCRMFKLHRNGGAVLGIILFIGLVLSSVPRGGISLIVVLALIFVIGVSYANSRPVTEITVLK